MFKVFAQTFRLIFALLLAVGGVLLAVLRIFSDLAPDVTTRLDAPFDHDEDFTWDGRQIID